MSNNLKDLEMAKKRDHKIMITDEAINKVPRVQYKVHIMTEEHVILSECPEDQLKAVEWAREQKKKILDDKSRRIADALMEKMTPLILKNSTQK